MQYELADRLLYPKYTDPQMVVAGLEFNNLQPYRRRIVQVTHLPAEQTPFLFHTSSQELDTVQVGKCQSYDYVLGGLPIPVAYALPYPHVNRVRQSSERWGPNRKEGMEQSGIPYTYIDLKNVGQIRMGSSMEEMYLLVVRNTEMVFSLELEEINKSGYVTKWQECVSLRDLGV